jgi:hypothetical protein
MAQKRKKKASDPGGAFTGPDHDPRTGIPDTGDVIGPDADDPDPPEVVDPADPSFVDPAEVE